MCPAKRQRRIRSISVASGGNPRHRFQPLSAGRTARQEAGRQLRRPFFHIVILGIVVAAAFYASFVPNRGTTRASGLLNSSAGLTFSGEAIAPPQLQAASIDTQFAPKTDSVGQSSTDAILSAGPIQPGQPASSDSTGGTQSAGLLVSPTPQAGATPAAAAATDPASPPDCDASQSDLYCVYEVQEGDTLSGIAQRYNLKTSDSSDLTSWQILVLSNKPDIVSEDDILQPGQHLRIPLHNGVVHNVVSSQTLTDIAGEYGVAVDDIMSVNHLTDANSIGVGTEILIPDPQHYSPAGAEEAAASTDSSSSGDTSGSSDSSTSTDSSGSSDSSSGSSSSGAIVAGGPKSNVGFIWPVTGPISSYFGPSHPLGIDIDLFSHHHAPIAAIAGGVVTFAGGNACCSYGYYVVVDHGNGYQSLYAHLSTISVSVGQVVSQGQQLGISGVTGYSTGEHLHFEIHKNGAVVNPLNYLP